MNSASPAARRPPTAHALLLILVTMLVLPVSGSAQSGTDSLAVLNQMLSNWEDSETLQHFFGGPPETMPENLGGARLYCIVFAPSLRALDSDPSAMGLSAGQIRRIEEVVSTQFRLERAELCSRRQRADGGPPRFGDSDGEPAVAILASTVFGSEDTVTILLGVYGLWPGFKVWDCELERRDGEWVPTERGCRYWET